MGLFSAFEAIIGAVTLPIDVVRDIGRIAIGEDAKHIENKIDKIKEDADEVFD